jgi:hypothetical protein
MTGDFAAKQQSSCHTHSIDFIEIYALSARRCSAARQPSLKCLAA